MSCTLCDYSTYPQPTTGNYLSALSNNFAAFLLASPRWHYAINLNNTAGWTRALAILDQVSRPRIAVPGIPGAHLDVFWKKHLPGLVAITTDDCHVCPLQEFDRWFYMAAVDLIAVSGGNWNLGKAQKFINMCIKYHLTFYFFGGHLAAWNAAHSWVEKLVCCFHAPLDRQVLTRLRSICRQQGLPHGFILHPHDPTRIRPWTQWPDTPAGWSDYWSTQNLIRWYAWNLRPQPGRVPDRPWNCTIEKCADCGYEHSGTRVGIDPRQIPPDFGDPGTHPPCPGALPAEMDEADGLWATQQ